MTMQPYRVKLAIASPSEIEHTARQLMAVREDFLTSGNRTLYAPRPLILDSWQRCLTLQVNPARRCAPLAVARDSQLAQIRAENALLIEAATPIINRLVDFLSDSGYVIVLSDAHGCLLDVVGDVAIRRRLARIDFIPGGNWNEAAAGTNAIGTALTDGHVVQLMAAEHYCDGWQDLTCTAAPIRHPFSDEIIGILDVTGDYHLIRPFLTSLLAAYALEIKQRLQFLLLSRYHNRQRCYIMDFIMQNPGNTHANRLPVDLIDLSKRRNRSMSVGEDFIKDIQSQLDVKERRAHDAERLAAAAGVISASLDLHVTLEKVVEQTAHLLHVERAGVYLFDESDKKIVLMHVLATQVPAWRDKPHIMIAQFKNAGAITLIRERGEPVVINDIHDSPLLPDTFSEQTGMHAIMLLPLVTARGVSGFITASRSVAQEWSVEDIRLGLAFSTQSATAIENARLFDALHQHNRHIEALNAIAHILSTLPDPSQHLNLVLQRITEIINFGSGLILLLDQSSEQLALAAHCGLAAGVALEADTFPLQALQVLARRVIALRNPLMIYTDDCEEAALREALLQTGFYDVVAVPMTASNMLIGILLIGNKSREYHDMYMSEDVTFFSTVGQQLGLAIRNAQLLRSASEMDALREADRLKSGFLAAVSHDLRSPLTAIRASVESLLDLDGIQSASGKEHLLLNIAGQASRLGQLVDQLLDLSRIEAGVLALDCDWTELSVLIADAITEFEQLYEGCHIELSPGPDLPLYYVDPARLRQVLWNLLENVYKYAPHNAPICITARALEGEVLISVEDRGPGIPRGEHKKVFERFYRLQRDQLTHSQGTGLGLAICHGIVESHGGRIWVEDRAGGGSVFYVALPLFVPTSMGLDASEEQELLV